MLEKIDLTKYEHLLALAKAHPDADLAALETTLALLLVAERVQAAMEDNLGCFNLSRGRFKILLELMMAPGGKPLTPAELALKVDVSRGTMSGLLDTLAKDHLIERTPCTEDRRTILVGITPDGLALIQRMLPENFQKTERLMQFLPAASRPQLIDLLVKINAGIAAFRG